MKRILPLSSLVMFLVLTVSLSTLSFGVDVKGNDDNLIQLAILLDTSNSMDGLINQAKAQLWEIVNELTEAKRKGDPPKLNVALYEYGNNGLSAGENYIRMVAPLTDDLDLISEELFKLTTNGGHEYCGAVIDAAARELKWIKDDSALKLIFIAGNEPFTQGQINYADACEKAIAKGIIVNTIHCGSYNEGIKGSWNSGAALADGAYLNIDHNQKIAHIDAPQDAELIKLGAKLNDTYVYYGAMGAKNKMRQTAQDTNAKKLAPAVMASRAVTKSSVNYSNSSWDIIDGEEAGLVKVAEMIEEELPEELKGKTVDERKEYIQEKKQEREKIQKQIKKLNKEREEYLKEKRKENAKNKTLDSAVIKAIRKQAEKKDFVFK